jgi:predicted transcriptional regulator
MPVITVSPDTQHLIRDKIAQGAATTEEAFVAAAVRWYAALDDEYLTVAAALRGIADIEAGRFVTITTDADREVLRKKLRTEAARFAASLGGRMESRARVVAAGLSDDDIDRLIKRAQHEVEPLLPR